MLSAGRTAHATLLYRACNNSACKLTWRVPWTHTCESAMRCAPYTEPKLPSPSTSCRQDATIVATTMLEVGAQFVQTSQSLKHGYSRQRYLQPVLQSRQSDSLADPEDHIFDKITTKYTFYVPRDDVRGEARTQQCGTCREALHEALSCDCLLYTSDAADE